MATDSNAGIATIQFSSLTEEWIWLMWLPVGLYFLLTIFILHLLQDELAWYMRARYAFMKEPRVENFTIGDRKAPHVQGSAPRKAASHSLSVPS